MPYDNIDMTYLYYGSPTIDTRHSHLNWKGRIQPRLVSHDRSTMIPSGTSNYNVNLLSKEMYVGLRLCISEISFKMRLASHTRMRLLGIFLTYFYIKKCIPTKKFTEKRLMIIRPQI